MDTAKLYRRDDGIWDLEIEDGVATMVSDGTAAAVGITEDILLFRSECHESPIVDTAKNPLAGINYYGIVYQTDKTLAEKEIEIKRAIKAADNVVAITSFSLTQSDRTAYISATVLTEWGEISVSQEITTL